MPAEPSPAAVTASDAPTVPRRGRFVGGAADPEENGKVGEFVDIDEEPSLTPVDRPHKLSKRERRQLGRLRARKVRRIVRHVDPWSVLKLSLVFYACLFVIVMVAGTVLWNLAAAAGTISDIEGFIKDLGAFKSFNFEGATIFRASLLGGLILVIAGTALNVLLAVLFNLVSDLVGGIRFTILEEDTARRVVPDRDA